MKAIISITYIFFGWRMTVPVAGEGIKHENYC